MIRNQDEDGRDVDVMFSVPELEPKGLFEDPRAYDDGKSIVRPRAREISSKLERFELIRDRLEKFFSKRITMTFDSRHSSTDLKIPHELKRIPEDIIFAIPDANATIYRGLSPWTEEFVFLRSTAACTVRAYLVVR